MKNNHSLGREASQDEKNAWELFQTAAERNDPAGVARLGYRFLHSSVIAASDFPKIRQFLFRAVASGNRDVLFTLGEFYAHAKNPGQNYAKAADYYKKALDAGVLGAFARLAELYAQGLGVSRDDAKALELYAGGADQGDSAAQYGLAMCYLNGRGTSVSLPKAEELLRKAAAGGFAPAREQLVQLEAQGHSAPPHSPDQPRQKDSAAAAGTGRKRPSAEDSINPDEQWYYVCPCGNIIMEDVVRFCPECGLEVEASKSEEEAEPEDKDIHPFVCPCGNNELSGRESYCPKCGRECLYTDDLAAEENQPYVCSSCRNVVMNPGKRYCSRCGTAIDRSKHRTGSTNIFQLNSLGNFDNDPVCPPLMCLNGTLVTVSRYGLVKQYACRDIVSYIAELRYLDNTEGGGAPSDQPQFAVTPLLSAQAEEMRLPAKYLDGMLILGCKSGLYALDLYDCSEQSGKCRRVGKPIDSACTLLRIAVDGCSRAAALIRQPDGGLKILVYEFDAGQHDFVLFHELTAAACAEEEQNYLYLTPAAVYLLRENVPAKTGTLKAFSLASFAWSSVDGSYKYLQSYDSCERLLLKQGGPENQIVRLDDGSVVPRFLCVSRDPYVRCCAASGKDYYLLGNDLYLADCSGSVQTIMQGMNLPRYGQIHVAFPPVSVRREGQRQFVFIYERINNLGTGCAAVIGADQAGYNPLKLIKGGADYNSLSPAVPLAEFNGYILALQNNTLVAFTV